MTLRSAPEWLAKETVLALHAESLAEHGGGAGLRDDGLLESALARPLQLFSYGDPPPDLAALAAAYGMGLAKNHAFVDGNKRIALIAMLTFLMVNGLCLTASQPEAYQTMISAASGTVGDEALADWIRANSAPLT
jgi:death on curing protein